MTASGEHHQGPPSADSSAQQALLVRLMLLSVAAAVVTISLKILAAGLTGSIGFLSDALESGVNLVAALVALWAIRLAARPPDLGHHFGHGKSEYISAALEGALILVAAAYILWTAIERLINPVELEQLGLGLALTAAASVVNLGVGIALVRFGRRERSIAVVADGRHLLTDVITSAGVILGIGVVALTGWNTLDPIVALVVGVNICFTGYGIVRRSVTGLLDAAIPPEDAARVESILDRYRAECPVDFHALRTRESGRQRFVYVHLLVPDEWTVKRGHDLAEELANDVRLALPGARTFVHIEPISDPASYEHDHLPTATSSGNPRDGNAHSEVRDRRDSGHET